MSEPKKEPEVQVLDLLPLVAETIRSRLRVLQQIDEADAQTKHINKHVARERQELLNLALRTVEVSQAFGIKGILSLR